MTKLILGFVFGLAVALLGCWSWVYPWVARQKFEYGKSLGAYNAHLELAREIPQLLGEDIDPNEPKQYFFDAKDESVVIVTHNGVKTLRLCCDGTEPKPPQ
jgi:hypothetical protein